MTMVKTVIEIDQQALAIAAEVLARRQRRTRSTQPSARWGSGWCECEPWPRLARWPTAETSMSSPNTRHHIAGDTRRHRPQERERDARLPRPHGGGGRPAIERAEEENQ